MARVCFILVAGLNEALLKRFGVPANLGKLGYSTRLSPLFPGLTCSVQATMSTGALPGEHGIIANGLYTFDQPELQGHLDLSNHAATRQQVSFWEQSNTLLQKPRFWAGKKLKVAQLFWQQSMGGAADIVLTPKPTHTPDGKTISTCWSQPAELNAELTAKLGPFPLHKYWGPMAGIESTQWITQAAISVWRNQQPDLQLVYLPHLDYNLQRLGPEHPAIAADLTAVDALLGELIAAVQADGGQVIVAGDYGIVPVDTVVMPNLALRNAGLLKTTADATGKLVVDYAQSRAFAMVDHQIAYVYLRGATVAEVAGVLKDLPGLGRMLTTPEDLVAVGMDSPRSGKLMLLAQPTAWFAHDWWQDDSEKPQWQFGVDIHSKPGYDPRELFFDPQRKCIAQDGARLKGSHGLASTDGNLWPVLRASADLPQPGLGMTQIPALLERWLGC